MLLAIAKQSPCAGSTVAVLIPITRPSVLTIWSQVRSAHLERIAWSYAAIPAMVAVAFARNGRFGWVRVLEASALIALVKLVLTAVVLIAVALAR